MILDEVIAQLRVREIYRTAARASLRRTPSTTNSGCECPLCRRAARARETRSGALPASRAAVIAADMRRTLVTRRASPGSARDRVSPDGNRQSPRPAPTTRPAASAADPHVLAWERWLAEIDDGGFFGADGARRADVRVQRTSTAGTEDGQPASQAIDPPGKSAGGRPVLAIDFPLWQEDWLFYPFDLSAYFQIGQEAEATSGESAGDDEAWQCPPRTESMRQALLESAPFAVIPLITLIIMMIIAFR